MDDQRTQVRARAACSRSSASWRSPVSRYAVRYSGAQRAAMNSLNVTCTAIAPPSEPGALQEIKTPPTPERLRAGPAGLLGRQQAGGTEGGEEAEPVGAGAAEVLDGVLGVGHQADHVACVVGDTGDGPLRAVGVADVPRHHASLALELVERALIGDERALAVLQHDRDLLAGVVRRRPGRAVVL